MTNVFTLEAELRQLEGELEQDPRARRAALIRDFLTKYRATQTAGVQYVNGFAQSANSLTKEERAKVQVLALLKLHGTVSRQNLLKHLTEQGIVGQESKPVKIVSKYLSKWVEVKTDGRGNWSLA